MRAGQRLAIADLQEQIERLEGDKHRRATVPFGVGALDTHVPGGGITLGALHEIIESGPAAEFAGAATLFTAGIAARLKGPVVWCLTRRDLFAPGLAAAGLHPDRVIYVEASRDREVLPLVEEALREKGLAAVVGEVTRLSLVASRRLQLAAEASGVPALMLRRWWTVAEKNLTTLPTAAITRWRIASAPSAVLPIPGVSRQRWRVDLVRCRGAEARSWIVEGCDAKGRLAVPADLAHRPHSSPVRQAAYG
ncbi:ImuA family protein [Microvirga thermotolerans]|uniref:Damage-inducible mutagenesis protein n=1 Tax=Microvirga thermotolerans TaxID=2651334 RepID=A0A5P9JXU3_9HYPH|nr:damage-inducible mutagenesis protein [Microvirga thermotolerans]QFU16578.1 damage-inducible mutagenesis protein [Microvirga thermotolerans]